MRITNSLRFAGVLTCSALVLSACGNPTDAENAGESGAGEINLVISNHPWQRGIEPLISDFEEETGIKVNVQTFAEQQARDRIQLNLSSRSDAMDVFMTLPSREGPLFSNSEYYEPLDSYLEEAPEEYEAEDFSEAAFEGMIFNDQVMALPINVEGPVLYYRTDVFEELGLEPPSTVEELLDVAETIDAERDDVIPVTLRGAAAALPFTFGPFLHGNGGSWTTNGGPNFEDPAAIRAIDEYATLAREYGPDGVINYSFTESSNLFAQGGVAMEIESSNELNSLIDPSNSTVPDEVGVVPMPAGTEGSVPTVLSWGLAMSASSNNKDEAWEFMQWATSPEVQLQLTEADIAPPRDGVAAHPQYLESLDSPVLQQWSEAVQDLQENGNTEVGPVGENAPAMREVVGNAIGRAILGQASPEEAAAEIQDGLAPLLDEEL